MEARRGLFWLALDHFGLRGRDQGEREREGTASLRARLDLDIAPVLAGQLARKVEVQTRAADVAGLTVLDPLEAAEQPREVLTCDSDAAVDHAEGRDPIHRGHEALVRLTTA